MHMIALFNRRMAAAIRTHTSTHTSTY